jgi:hypothetical protein
MMLASGHKLRGEGLMPSTDTTDPSESRAKSLLLERNTIGPIPPNERSGSPRGLFGIWFGINMLPLTVVTGVLATPVFGLPFWWGVAAVVIGNLVGGVFMALHASQGPQLGVPQMIQGRTPGGDSAVQRGRPNPDDRLFGQVTSRTHRDPAYGRGEVARC